MSQKQPTEPPSQAVIELVAEAEDVDPVDLDVPLYDAVDPEALDALFESTAGSSRLNGQTTFEYLGHTVVVASDGTVELADEVATSPPLAHP